MELNAQSQFSLNIDTTNTKKLGLKQHNLKLKSFEKSAKTEESILKLQELAKSNIYKNTSDWSTPIYNPKSKHNTPIYAPDSTINYSMTIVNPKLN